MDARHISDQRDLENTPIDATALEFDNGVDVDLFVTALERFTKIDTLLVSFDSRPDDILPHLANIRALRFDRCPPKVVASWLSLPHIQSVTFTLAANALEILDGLAYVQEARHIQHLGLAHNHDVEDWVLETVQHMPHIKRLSLDQCSKLTPRVIDELVKASTLKGLSLSTTPGEQRERLPEWIAALADLTQIEELSITGCRDLSDEDMAPLSDLIHLRELSLTDCRSITSCAFIAKLEQLKSLRLRDCEGMNDGLDLLTSLGQLETLEISGNQELPAEDFSALAGLGTLKSLNLGKTRIDAATLNTLCDSLIGLEHLVLAGCQGLSRVALSCLTRLSSLESLNLAAVDLSGQIAFVRDLEGLRHLDITDSRLGDNDLGLLGECKDLLELDFNPTDLGTSINAVRRLFATKLPAIAHYVFEYGIDDENDNEHYIKVKNLKTPTLVSARSGEIE